MKIEVKEKKFYGNVRYEIIDKTQKKAVMLLSNKKTIGPHEIEPLKMLGFKVVLKPEKEKSL